jgi:tetratricopeptide (TPR) repeat protein
MAKFSQEFLRQMATPAFGQGLFTAAQQAAQLPAQLRQQQQMQQQRQQLAQMDPNTPEGLAELARFYQSQGDMANAAKFAKAARDLQAQLTAQTQLSTFQEQVAVAAEAAGLTEQAATARATTDMDELRGISKDVRAFQIEQLPVDNPQVIKARLKMAGFTPAQITAMGPLSADEADALLKGRTGKLEAWQDVNGNIKAVNVNDFGLVYNDQTDTYVKANELGLVRKAPNVIQQIVDTSQQVGREKMAEANVANFIKLAEKAEKALQNINIVDRQRAKLEGGMPTGILAGVELTLRRVGEALGRPYDPEITNAETYISETATLVRQDIKDFGSGSGVSDADREYAIIEKGGDIRLQAEALLKILEIQRSSFVKTIELYNDVRGTTAKQLGENNMTTYMPITMPQEPEEAEAVLPKGFKVDVVD